MNVKSILILILFLFWALLCWRYYTCDIKNLCGDADSLVAVEPANLGPIAFYKNTDSPFLTNFNVYRDSICQIAKTNEIEIIGYFSSDEKNTTPFENLGLARAEKLALLLETCMDSNASMTLVGQQREMKFKDNMLPATEVFKMQIPTDLVHSKEVEIVTNHGVSEIYFPIGSEKEIESEKLNRFLIDISRSASNKKIFLVGHTDNHGDEADNIQLSLNRSLTIKKILVDLGMPESNIICEGIGSAEPKADNSTPENRARNRRVELRIDK